MVTARRRREPPRPVVLKLLLGISACACALAATSVKAEFDVEVGAGFIQTDNVGLTAVDPQSETALQVIPEFRATHSSPRLEAEAVYRVEGYHYRDLGETEAYNQFDGEIGYDLVPERFTLNAGASRSIAIVDPQNTIPTNNFAFSTNRADEKTVSLGPSFQVPIGGGAVFAGDLSRMWKEYGETDLGVALPESTYDTGEVSVDNYRRGMGFTWALSYTFEKSKYHEAVLIPYEYRQVMTQLGAWVTDGTRLFASAGKESPWDDPLEPDPTDDLWEVGFHRTIGERFDAEIAAGERSFGSSQRATLDYSFEQGTVGLAYREAPTTNSADRYSAGGRGLLDPNDQNDYLFRPEAIERYLMERFEFNFDVSTNRTTISLGAFDEVRSDRTLVDGTPLPNETQRGLDVAVSWELGARTELTLDSLNVKREFGMTTGDTKLSTWTIEANYDIGPRTNLALSYEHTQEESEGVPYGNYRASLVSFLATRTF